MTQIIAVLGGTGNLGYALARRWALKGHKVVIGSREPEKAVAAAEKIRADGAMHVSGDENLAAAEAGDIVVLTVPFASQLAVLERVKPALAGKVLVDTTVPLVPPKVMRVQLPPEGCAALRARNAIGEEAQFVSAFHNVAAHKLATDEAVECDVLVFSDDKAAREKVMALAEAAGLRGIHGGALVNSAAAEAMTSLLIFINKTYRVDGAGIRITGKLLEPEG